MNYVKKILMKDNLIVGNTSQLSRYFPGEYQRISSREIPNEVFTKEYDSVYLTFGLSVKGLLLSEYMKINVEYTLELVDRFSKVANKVVVYSTCELWSNYSGGVTLSDPYDFVKDNYIISKHQMVREIKRKDFSNVIIIYPFNFNTPYRSEDFLFGKIFNSIINKSKIEIGDIDIYRDICNVKSVINTSITTNKDILIGSGLLVNVKVLVTDLYKHYGMDYDDYVTENIKAFSNKSHKHYYSGVNSIETYKNLLQSHIDTIDTFIH